MVFTLHADGSEYHVLHEFGLGDDGRYPWSLMEATNGALYGSLQSADVQSATIFELQKVS